MTEIQKLLHFYHAEARGGMKAALATLVHVEGSAYRRPGARMMILEDGRWCGSVSGGCLEGDVGERARQCMNRGQPIRVQYDTRDDATNVFGLAMGCDGIVDVVIEPISNELSDVIAHLHRLSSFSEAAIHFMCMTNPELATMSVWNWCGTLSDLERSSDLNVELRALGRDCLDAGATQSVRHIVDGQPTEILAEVILPQTRLVIFGAGYDAVALTTLAHNIGWHVTVLDKAKGKVVPERFPDADVVECVASRDASSVIKDATHTACVIMSHNIPYDAEVLSRVLPCGPRYIGVLGPHARMQKLRTHIEHVLHQDTSTLSFSDVYSPIGLNLGAETPEEIAVSVVAQILSVIRGRDARPLREKQGRIHEP